jgi:glycosyltransferase involved in cell wall biosynthesis
VFVPPAHAPALHSAIVRLQSDPALRTALGRRASARARELTIDRTADEYLRMYEDLLR